MAGHKELIFTGMLHIRLRTVLGYLKMMLEDKVNLSKVTIKYLFNIFSTEQSQFYTFSATKQD